MKGAAKDSSELARLRELARTLSARNEALELEVDHLEEKLFHCPLTGLHNEGFFQRYIPGAIDISLDMESDGALLFISIDRFSEVNIVHGSEIANETLRKFAAFLPNSVPPDSLLFRLSGALFSCYLPQADKERGAAVAERIRADIQGADIFVEPMTVSIGVVNIAEFSEQVDVDRGVLTERLLDRAKRRLGIARKLGFNAVCAESGNEADDGPRREVLLADHDAFRRKLLAEVLRGQGFDVREAVSGGEALDAVNRQAPSLVIAEFTIPGLDALTLRARLRASTELSRIPFLLIADRKSADNAARAYELGVSAFLQRPLIVEELTGLAKNLAAAGERHAP
jgi:diguanylate cyclase (GGDEF)-like protein